MMEIGELEGLRAARLSWAQICRLMFVRWLYPDREAALMGVWIIQAEVPAELVGLAIAAVLFSGMVGLLWLQARSLARWDRE